MRCFTLRAIPLLEQWLPRPEKQLLVARQSGRRGLTRPPRGPSKYCWDDRPETPWHIARISGKDPGVFSCHPSGDTTLKGKMFTSPVRAWSMFCESLRGEADKNLVRHCVLGQLPAKTLRYLSCYERRSFVSITENGDSKQIWKPASFIQNNPKYLHNPTFFTISKEQKYYFQQATWGF